MYCGHATLELALSVCRSVCHIFELRAILSVGWSLHSWQKQNTSFFLLFHSCPPVRDLGEVYMSRCTRKGNFHGQMIFYKKLKWLIYNFLKEIIFSVYGLLIFLHWKSFMCTKSVWKIEKKKNNSRSLICLVWNF